MSKKTLFWHAAITLTVFYNDRPAHPFQEGVFVVLVVLGAIQKPIYDY